MTTTSGASATATQQYQQMSSYYWLPSLAFTNQIAQGSTRSVASLLDSTSWLQDDGSSSQGADGLCTNGCAGLSYTTVLEAAQPYREYNDYKAYPFDTHVVIFRFGVEDGIFNCTPSAIQNLTQLTRQQLVSRVQPLSGEWALFREEPIRIQHAVDADGLTDLSQCELQIRISRQSQVQIVKSLVLSLVTVLACLLSSFMHPADHTGDRASIVLVAGLILTANIQADLNLGPLNYLIWQDGFNLILIVITLLALAQTVYVHRVWRHDDHQSRALSIDRICTLTIICFLFPIEVVGYGLTAFPENFAVGVALCVATPFISALAICFMVGKADRRRVINESAAVAAIQVGSIAPSGDPLRESQLRRAFKAFDRDKTGGLAADELRRLLRAAYPLVHVQDINHAVMRIQDRFFVQERMGIDDWIAAHAEVDPKLRSLGKEGGSSKGFAAQDLLGKSTHALGLGTFLKRRPGKHTTGKRPQLSPRSWADEGKTGTKDSQSV